MLKGLGNLGDMAKMMAKAQEFQAKMAEAQAAVEALEVEGEAGAGLVKAGVSGKGELKRLAIDPALFVPEDRERRPPRRPRPPIVAVRPSPPRSRKGPGGAHFGGRFRMNAF